MPPKAAAVPADTSPDFKEFLNATIQKSFPGHGRKTFVGHVKKIKGDSAEPFFVKYDDGDREWLTLDELKRHLVSEPPSQPDKGTGEPGHEDKPQSGVKRSGEVLKPTIEKHAKTENGQGALDAGSGRGQGRGRMGGRAARGRHVPQSPTSGRSAGLSGGSSKTQMAPEPPSETPDTKIAPGAADAKPQGAASQKPVLPKSKQGTASPPTPATDAGTSQPPVLASQGTSAEAITRDRPEQLSGGRQPRTCELVSHRGIFYLSGIQAPDTHSVKGQTYAGQVEQVFAELYDRITFCGLQKNSLLSVRVYLRDCHEGLPMFNVLWDDWVDHTALPALTIVQAQPPDPSALLVLEATAAANRESEA